MGNGGRDARDLRALEYCLYMQTSDVFGTFAPKYGVTVLVDLKAWSPFVVQASSLSDHHFVNGYKNRNRSRDKDLDISAYRPLYGDADA